MRTVGKGHKQPCIRHNMYGQDPHLPRILMAGILPEEVSTHKCSTESDLPDRPNRRILYSTQVSKGGGRREFPCTALRAEPILSIPAQTCLSIAQRFLSWTQWPTQLQSQRQGIAPALQGTPGTPTIAQQLPLTFHSAATMPQGGEQ